MSIFEDWQDDDRKAAVDWVAGAFDDGDEERTVLMQLQETGWTAEQSRAICNLAKNKRVSEDHGGLNGGQRSPKRRKKAVRRDEPGLRWHRGG